MESLKLIPRADGLLDAAQLPQFPIMAARLQGELASDGSLTLALWGSGDVGVLTLGEIAGPMVIAPGRIETAAGQGLYVAQSAPALLLRGVTPGPIHGGPGGRLSARQVGADWVLSAGVDEAEAARAATLGPEQIVAEARDYARACDLAPAAEPLLRSLVLQSAHAGLSSIRRYPDGGFAGLAAGLAYSTPARTYYRDGYWTLQLLLRIAPDIVAEQIELLARRIHADGEAPSGVIIDGPHAEAFERSRLNDLALAAVHWAPGEWWSDHFDSPLMFVLAVADHARVTGDASLARRYWTQIEAVFERYLSFTGFEGLPHKPRNDRDWADNVYREGLVSYDLGLWIGMLDAVAELGDGWRPQIADGARAAAAAGRKAIEAHLWRGDWPADYIRDDDSAEDHLALDALTLLRHDALPADKALTMLGQVQDRLESRRNTDQPYGDFGMLCCFPPFARAADLRAKSADAYRYHNGGDWPWLDALYAGERLRRSLSGWRYPLTRWWEWCLAQGWAGAVEHYSVPFGRGSLLQAWSCLPAAVALQYADKMAAGDPEA
ncbi:MAG TPA: hypothetical protein VGL58_00510 [Caulobacteraceae bacterium]|jgi:glycogen debranching enzyme